VLADSLPPRREIAARLGASILHNTINVNKIITTRRRSSETTVWDDAWGAQRCVGLIGGNLRPQVGWGELKVRG